MKVLLAGATGLVGREILARLLADRSITEVHTLGRRAPPTPHARLHHHASDLRNIPALPPPHTVFIALGTTIKVAGSQEAFRAVDHDAVLAVAHAARTAGATRLGLVSAMGADTGSRIFYSRVKGEVEQTIAQIGFETLVIARPSLLVGERSTLGQPVRRGEIVGEAISRWLRPLIPANARAIRATDVARALVDAVGQGQPGRRVLLSGQMQRG
ncbi:NAD-dependent epimerase/dehydratase family protein [Pseudorhodoferax sp. LjRoot39]|uniref:NAD(P)H-binding protein n=1 Tax=Pseudorhodoferax sp. LjRoot39 TaxID=3342328 RepID=UPI003ECCF179